MSFPSTLQRSFGSSSNQIWGISCCSFLVSEQLCWGDLANTMSGQDWIKMLLLRYHLLIKVLLYPFKFYFISWPCSLVPSLVFFWHTFKHMHPWRTSLLGCAIGAYSIRVFTWDFFVCRSCLILSYCLFLSFPFCAFFTLFYFKQISSSFFSPWEVNRKRLCMCLHA